MRDEKPWDYKLLQEGITLRLTPSQVPSIHAMTVRAGQGAVVPIRAAGLTLSEVEIAIIQTLAQGRKAAIDEDAVAKALTPLENAPARTVTAWADAFAAQYQVIWMRRRLFGDLLFALAEDAEKENVSEASEEASH